MRLMSELMSAPTLLLFIETRRMSSPFQKMPWWTSSASAPSSAARSMRSWQAVTPVTIFRISFLPSTCRPFGQ